VYSTNKDMIRTAFTRTFGLALPIVGAPMEGVSSPELAAAVAKAGGLGHIAAGRVPVDFIPRWVL
jgi:nitronate monooxygenase